MSSDTQITFNFAVVTLAAPTHGEHIAHVVLGTAVEAAAGVSYSFTLSPEIAALDMSGSSGLVAVNALMLKRTKLIGIRYSGTAD